MPSCCAISSAARPEPRRKALSRLPISSKRSIRARFCRAESVSAHSRASGNPVLSAKKSGSPPSRGRAEYGVGSMQDPPILGRFAQPPRRVERGGDDVVIAGAAAEISRYADADVVFGRIRIVAQEL